MAIDFDRLNRETRDYNRRNFSQDTPTIAGTQRVFNQSWQNYYNNQTYKANNGQYSKHYK